MKVKIISILSLLSLFIFSTNLYAEQVTGKVIWVAPFFGFVYIRLDNQKISAQDNSLDIYIKVGGKTGKITTISSYRDVTICKVEPKELVRRIRKEDIVSGNIKTVAPRSKMKSLIDETIIKEFVLKQQIEQEIEQTDTDKSDSGSNRNTITTEQASIKNKLIDEKFEEEKKKRELEEQNFKRRNELKQMEQDSKRREEEEKEKALRDLTAEQWFDKGETAGDTKFKIEYYSNALKLKPAYVEARFKLGKTYHDNGSLAEGLEEYLEAQKLDKGNALIHNNIADIYSRLGLIDQALDNAVKATIINPSLMVAWVTLGEIYETKGELDKAIEAYSHAIDDSKWKSYVTGKIEQLQKKKK